MTRAREGRVVLSCEHGGSRIPPRYRELFRGHEALLASHRGHDAGALALARALERGLGAPLYAATVSRLLVDLNRSPAHPRLFSAITRGLPAAERERILNDFYLPHRRAVRRAIAARIRRAEVMHLSVHSFTPVLDGQERLVDVGLLYDPARVLERELCRALCARLRAAAPDLRVRRNAPYKGVSDGLTTALRPHFDERRYAGIELEMNQRFARDGRAVRRIARLLSDAMRALGLKGSS